MVASVFLALRIDSERLVSKSDKIVVSATIFPLYDAASKIGGNQAVVSLILPAGASPHTFEPSPEILIAAEGSRVVFKIGVIDDWVDNIAISSGAAIFPVSEGVPMRLFDEGSEANDNDPHYWLSFRNAKMIARNIAAEFSKIDPDNKDYYENNLSLYIISIEEAERKTNLLSGLRGSKVASFHDAWGYFSDEQGFDIVSVFEESPGKEPSAREVRQFIDDSKEAGLKVFLVEPQFSTDSAGAVAFDAELSLAVVNPEGGYGEFDSYPDMLYENAKKIRDALLGAE